MSNYDDIIHLPHHVSKTRPHMSLQARAGQFAPFAALTGHGAALEETARLTVRPLELTESVLKELDGKLAFLRKHAGEDVQVRATYFVPDALKEGGSYHVIQDAIKRIDDDRAVLRFNGGEEIPVSSIVELEFG